MMAEELFFWLLGHWKELLEEVKVYRYHLAAVRRVEIPKPNKGIRRFGMPKVTDRMLQ
jgi:RNA-directed DNA polymerase